MHARTHVCIGKHARTQTHIRAYSRIYTRARTHAHTHTHAHTYTECDSTNIHTCMESHRLTHADTQTRNTNPPPPPPHTATLQVDRHNGQCATLRREDYLLMLCTRLFSAHSDTVHEGRSMGSSGGQVWCLFVGQRPSVHP